MTVCMCVCVVGGGREEGGGAIPLSVRTAGGLEDALRARRMRDSAH